MAHGSRKVIYVQRKVVWTCPTKKRFAGDWQREPRISRLGRFPHKRSTHFYLQPYPQSPKGVLFRSTLELLLERQEAPMETA